MTSQPRDALLGSYSRNSLVHSPARSLGTSIFPQTVMVLGLSIFVFALPTQLRLYGDISVTLPVGSFCVALGVLDVMRRRTVIALPLGFWCLMAFVIWGTCSLAWAEHPSLTMSKLIKYWEFLPMTWVIAQHTWDRRVRIRLFDAYVAGCWCGVLGVFFHYASGQEFITQAERGFERRYSFGSDDPNFLALALVIGICIACYRACSDAPGWKRLLFLSYIPAAFVTITLTGSRGALLALLAAAVTFGICSTLRRRIAMLIGAAICLVLTLALPSALTSRFSTIPDELNYGTLSGRRDLWDEGTAFVERHPFQGAGIVTGEGGSAFVAHNTPLEILIEGGLVSLVLFYGVFANGIYRVWRVAGQEQTVLLALCGAWLVGTFSLSWDVDPITWFIFAMLLSAGLPRKLVESRVVAAVR